MTELIIDGARRGEIFIRYDLAQQVLMVLIYPGVTDGYSYFG